MRFFLISSILLSTAAWANDGVFLGSGGDVYPIENDQIAMAKETLVIEETGPWRWGVGGWKVTVEYVFENTTDASVRLQFGFPEKCRREPGDIDDENAFVCDSPGIKDFRAWLDGKPRTVSVKRFRPEKKRALNHRGFGRVHTFEVTFAPKQRRRVKHTYSVGGYADSAMGAGVEYVLETGALWAGPIGELDIQVIWKTRYDGIEVIGKGPRAMPKPTFRGRRGGVYVIHWALKNFEPKGDLDIYSMLPLVRETWMDLQERMRAVRENPELALKGKSKESLRILRNLPYAVQGYTFKDPALRKHFEATAWYAPRADYDPAWITREDHAFISAVKAYEDTAVPVKKEPVKSSTKTQESNP